MRAVWLIASVFATGLTLWQPATALPCSDRPQVHPGDLAIVAPDDTQVGAFYYRTVDLATVRLLVEREDGSSVPGTTTAIDGASFYQSFDRDGFPTVGTYLLFLPETALDVGTWYDVTLVETGGDENRPPPRATFQARSTLERSPFEATYWALTTEREVVNEACCYDADVDSCGNARFCVAEETTLKAALFFSQGQALVRGNARYLYRVDQGPLQLGPSRKVFEELADALCADLTVLDLAAGTSETRRVCAPPDPLVAYGTWSIDPFEVQYDRAFCLGPPTARYCRRLGVEPPENCPAASPVLAEAWCGSNIECRTAGDDPTCRFYEFYCGRPEPELPTDPPEAEPRVAPEPVGCAASPSSPAGTGSCGVLTAAVLCGLTRRRRRKRTGPRLA